MLKKQKLSFSDAFVRMFAGIRAYVWLFAGLFIVYLLAAPSVLLFGNSSIAWPAIKPYSSDADVMLVMALLLLALVGTALLLHSHRQLTAGRLAAFIITSGIILRFGYMLYTPFYVRGHDILAYTGRGHLAYIYRLYNLQGLPESFVGQFYHPPFAHILDAAVAKLYALISKPSYLDTYFEASRLVPCFASCALLVMSGRLLDELSFSKRAKNVAVAVIAFHPTFILLSSSINNDMLMIFFFMTAFLYSVRWYRNPSYKNIILLALAIGSAMSTKFSGALIAVFTAMLFLIALFRQLKEGKSWDLAPKFAVFAAICLPLGLWYHFRNLRLFGQRLGYVASSTVKSSLYVGDKTLSERFLSFSLPDMLNNVYCQPFNDFKLWEYTVKCALFGEYTFSEKHHALADILIVSSLSLILLSLGAMVWFLFIDRRRSRFAVLSFSFLWLLLMLSFVYFNFKYPFGCTMDFRYIVPTVITGAAFLGLLSDKLAGSKLKNGLFTVFCTFLAVFCISSAIFYVI